MKKKYKLEIVYPPEFILYSITSTLKDYKLVFNLNKIPGIKFKRIQDYERPVKPTSDEKLSHPVYHYSDCEKSYTLITAKSKETRLFPSLKQTDYLLLINGNHNPESLQSFISEVKKTPNIIIIFDIQANTPQLENFLNDMELHLIGSNSEI